MNRLFPTWLQITGNEDPTALLIILYLSTATLGVYLLLVTLFREQKSDEIPLSITRLKKASQVVVASILLIVGGREFASVALPRSLTMAGSLAPEELEVFQNILTDFETFYHNTRKRYIKVHFLNLSADQIVHSLSHRQPLDLISFDISSRHELIRRDLVRDLSDEAFKRIIPSTTSTHVLDYLESPEARFFLPYRPNVRVLFVDCSRLGPQEIDELTTWHGFLNPSLTLKDHLALAANPKDDAPLLLLELIRNAGGDPLNPCGSKSLDALLLLTEHWPSLARRSSELDWHTALGGFLSGQLYAVRNWSFSLGPLARTEYGIGSGRCVQVRPGLKWNKDSEIKTILGGEVLAIPHSARYPHEAKALADYLLSENVQKVMVDKIAWPSFRQEISLGQFSKGKRFEKAVHDALKGASPTPKYWSHELKEKYKEVFDVVKKRSTVVKSKNRLLEIFRDPKNDNDPNNDLCKSTFPVPVKVVVSDCEDVRSKRPEISCEDKRLDSWGMFTKRLYVSLRDTSDQITALPRNRVVVKLKTNGEQGIKLCRELDYDCGAGSDLKIEELTVVIPCGQSLGGFYVRTDHPGPFSITGPAEIEKSYSCEDTPACVNSEGCLGMMKKRRIDVKAGAGLLISFPWEFVGLIFIGALLGSHLLKGLFGGLSWIERFFVWIVSALFVTGAACICIFFGYLDDLYRLTYSALRWLGELSGGELVLFWVGMVLAFATRPIAAMIRKSGASVWFRHLVGRK